MTQPEHKGSIFVIDDAPENITILKQMLAEYGYLVRPARDGRTALKAIHIEPPEIILLDIMMPEMDGWEVCSRLKSDERTREIPVLFISSLSDADDKVKGFSVGGVDFITKPFHVEEVLSRVETHLKLRRMQKKLQEQNRRLTHEIEERKRTEEALEKANCELGRLASLDGLTHIANRRKFDHFLKNECNRLSRQKVPLALILCDIDFFKNYNDSYGHVAGDDCLKRVADVLQQAITRPTDLVARYGGEEFAVILPNTDLNGALLIAEKIQHGIKDLRIPHNQSAASQYITVSIGLTSSSPDQLISPEGLLLVVDKALYKAKKAGRNQLVISEVDKAHVRYLKRL